MRHYLAICCFLFLKLSTILLSMPEKEPASLEDSSHLSFLLHTSTLKILQTPLMHSRESNSQKFKERKQNDRQSFEIGVQAM